MRFCSFPECSKKHRAKSLCTGHYNQQARGETLAPLGARGGRGLTGNLGIHYPATMSAIHRRVWKLWGPASDHSCVACGNPADEWAYDGTDESELFQQKNQCFISYSRYPEFYMPMCLPHHRHMDVAWRAAEAATEEDWNHMWVFAQKRLARRGDPLMI